MSDNLDGFDEGLGRSHLFDGEFLDIDFVVDDEKRIGISEDLIVEGDTIEILLEHSFKNLVFLLKLLLLLLNSDSIKLDFIISLVEVIQVGIFSILFR
jgi:hypothetical protein